MLERLEALFDAAPDCDAKLRILKQEIELMESARSDLIFTIRRPVTRIGSNLRRDSKRKRRNPALPQFRS